jgi:hypothetical protein
MIIYQGPSLLDGKPIAAVLTRGSKNPKTGPMLQTWIIRADIPPHAAATTGKDTSICGDCRHRPTADGTCYVNTWQAPAAIYRKFNAGLYPASPRSRLHLLADSRHVRLGAYGDPAAVPIGIWRDLTKSAAGHSGYTHQWRTTPALRPYVMASTDTPQETAEAQALGWRTFRVRAPEAPLQPGELACPASDEAGKKTQCIRCGLCAGARLRAPSLAIIVHGNTASRFAA